jgi:hypothetical protein
MHRAAVLMETGGFPPGGRTLAEMAACERAFARLRAEVIDLAGSAGVHAWAPEDVLSFYGLATLLDAVIQAEDVPPGVDSLVAARAPALGLARKS